MNDGTPDASAIRRSDAGAALLIIDMMNVFDFEGAEDVFPSALKAAHAIAKLRTEAAKLHLPVVYVNDNFNEWHSERSRLVERALEHDNPVAQLLRPRKDDFFIIKPQFSGFYATNLQVLLPRLGVSRLILSGMAADICVLFTAADAHMREYDLWVPGDVVAASSCERKAWALEIMKTSMGAETADTSRLSLLDWLDRSSQCG